MAQQYGTLLIADEIATGMGRTGQWWACQWEQVAPDILCIGKGLSGGYLPVSATLTSRRIWNAFLGDYGQSRSFFHGHTYGGNPLGSAAAVATLSLFEQEQTLDNVARQSAYLQQQLRCLEDHPHVGDIRVRGLAAAVELVQCRSTGAGFPWQDKIGHQICQRALRHGVWLRPLGNVLVLMPPLCISSSEIEHWSARSSCLSVNSGDKRPVTHGDSTRIHGASVQSSRHAAESPDS